jgi:hypothetical protein
MSDGAPRHSDALIDRWSGARCPECGYDLSATITGGVRRCPECGFEFRPSQVFPPRTATQPRRRNPHEWRLHGPLGCAVLLLMVLGTIGLWVALAVTLS